MSFSSRSFALALSASVPCLVPVFAFAQDSQNVFSLSAQSLTSALTAFSRQTGVHVAFDANAANSLRSAPLYGKMDNLKALRRLLGKNAFKIDASNPKNITLHARPARKSTGTEADMVDNLTVRGSRHELRTKRNFAGVVDSITYDDTSNLGGATSMAQLLTQLPGVTGIRNGDEPRYISVRGVSSDLNQTTLDGMTLASISDGGSIRRRVNMQNIPAEMTGEDDIYKTFTAEQDGGAIGAVINMNPRSAFDHDGLYKYINAYGIYGTEKGSAGANRIPGMSPHLGQGAKAVFSDRFGAHKEFGIMTSFRYQRRTRNTTKKWQEDSYNYYNAKGKILSPNDPSTPGWNGMTAPRYVDGGSYSNDLNSLGGAARLEWHPENSGFNASVMGYSYERWENSFMEHNEYLLDDTAIWNQTPTSGREYIYRARTIGRKDNWRMNTNGVLGNLSWHDNISTLKLRAGYTWEDYYNHEPYVTARVYPKENAKGAVYADYTINKDNVANLVDIIDMNKLLNSGYAFQTVQQEYDRDHEGVTNVRLDYTRNLNPDFHGFGFASGFEWRSLNATNSSDQLWYKPGGNAASSMFIPNMQNPNGPFFDLTNFPWDKQTPDPAKSKNYTELAYFRYQEQLFDGYVSLHYKWRKSQIIAGVRADSVNFNAFIPGTDSSSNPTGKIEKNRGGYINPLPSVTFVHEFPKNLILHAVYSQSVGRPQPTDLAQAAQYSCGDSQNTLPGDINCSLSRGNPNLMPRKAQNFDISLDKFFNRGKGVFSVAYFDKMIKHDIYTTRSTELINDELTYVTQPRNANNSSLMGVEVSVVDRSIQGPWRQSFDINASGTWMRGRMTYQGVNVSYKLKQLTEQPSYVFNGSVTWHIPQIRGAVKAAFSYSAKYLEGLNDDPTQMYGYGSQPSLDLGAWNDITDNLRLKYEVYNLAGSHTRMYYGEHLNRLEAKEDYGRSIYFELVYN
ncbi:MULTISPECIES: outer membrane beta-barrel protein [Gluconobacter]|uniref:Outer membrane beta-barrel protein n=1 Tax=Gluconobacter cadivus TaxID=2728101 RepID=A0ABR9YW17_9PROT|nr:MULTISPECIES: outer membrane beta-barrel protein [Gluconobacter]MBF0888735.1 outer membrane beta-barrel protein [Gluconobacter cadivus]MBS1059926.1 outer membrane beta-barrel protein [Gluconobacter sp. Dm-44]